MYKAIANFKDRKDNCRVYHAGDKYPRDGYRPEDDWLNALLSGNNRTGKPMIAQLEEKPAKKATTKKQKLEG